MTWIDNQNDVFTLLCTVPNEQVANEIASHLVQNKLAACVNVLAGVQSIYQWKGEVCHDQELLLIIKTTKQKLESVAEQVKSKHPYETPELIACPVVAGLLDYLQWVRTSTN